MGLGCLSGCLITSSFFLSRWVSIPLVGILSFNLPNIPRPDSGEVVAGGWGGGERERERERERESAGVAFSHSMTMNMDEGSFL